MTTNFGWVSGWMVDGSSTSLSHFARVFMRRSIAEIAAEFDALTVADFDFNNRTANGTERLAELCNEMSDINQPLKCAPILFRTMERLDGADLGSPGPLAHTLEKWGGAYETFLAESVRRKPTPLSVWMINRILNAKRPNSDDWMALLRSVLENQAASEETKTEAQGFVEFQNGT
jgi:hypothetical protein